MPVPPELEELLASFPCNELSDGSLSRIAETIPDIVDEIRKYDPLKSASCIAALLCNPDYQGNAYRLEWLLHLCVAYGSGAAIPSPKTLLKWFDGIGDRVAHYEDPSESVFVDVIRTPFGNFKILEGLWTFGTFCTQRVVDAIIHVADPRAADDLLPSIIALLTISDEVCNRLQLGRFLLGEEMGQRRLKSSDAKRAKASRRHLKFTQQQLQALNVDEQRLNVFGFVPSTREALKSQKIGNTNLERFPLAYSNGETLLLNPTAVCASIRRYVYDEFRERGLDQYLSLILREEYQRHDHDLPLFGGSQRLQIPLGFIGQCHAGGGIRQIDPGRYLGRILLVDDLEGFSEGGLDGGHPHPERFTETIREIATDVIASVRKEDPEGEILIFVTFCGLGRNVAINFPHIEDEAVRFHGISAADYETLAKDSVFNEKEIWRTVDAFDDLASQQIMVMNPSGILNLVAWMRNHDGHIVPPNRFDFDYQGGPLMFNFDHNAMRSIRHSVLTQNDEQFAEFVDGSMFPIRRFSDSYFKEDDARSVYATTEWTGESGLHIVYLDGDMNWWAEVSVPKEADTRFYVQRSELIKTWLPKIANVLGPYIPEHQRHHLLIQLHFDAVGVPNELPNIEERGRVEDCIHLDVNHEENTIALKLSAAFENFLYDGANIAEAGIVRHILLGCLELFSLELICAQIDELLEKIIPNPLARQAHAFQAREFRDVMLPVTPNRLKLSKIDESRAAFGLGWKVRDRSDGMTIEGKTESTAYLNSVCAHMLEHVSQQLRHYDRASFILKCAQNYEATVKDRNNWRRTAAANINLRDDKEAAQATIAERDFENTRILLGLRALIEMGICECPLEGGKKCGDIDLGRLIADVMQAIAIGGMSDAIHWGVTPPAVRITGFGSIEIDFSFYESVMFPFIKKGTDLTIESEVEKYDTHTDEPPEAQPMSTLFDAQFLEACEEQFGFSIDAFRDVCEAIEDMGVERQKIAFQILSSELDLELSTRTALSKDEVRTVITRLSLPPRDAWNDVPDGFHSSDTSPWRYRRQLSILQKPLFQIDRNDDPLITVTPGVFREALFYQFRSLHEGTFPNRQLSPKMRKWKTKVESSIGHEFEADVAHRLEESGWKTKQGRKLTEVFGQKLEKDFGDIDVLAWNEQSGRILVIECKDLQYKKTPGEVAEQLADFQGELTAKGKPDLLLKHLLRLRKLRESPEQLQSYLKLEVDIEIEGLVAFRHPVPMMYALDSFHKETGVATYSELRDI